MNNLKIHGTQIELKNCSKTYENGFLALEPLNLTIKAGETIVLLGPSGCGKTSLLRLIAGLEEVDKNGEIFFDGEEIGHLPIEKRKVGMMFQAYALFPNMNVRENIAYGLKVQRIQKDEIKKSVDEMLEMMDIQNLAYREINQLSGGQKQRVALARAIVTRPKVLLLDEPLSALDALLRNSLRADIDNLLKKLGITSIYVTHDQSEAMALGDRIVVMSKGKISQIGTPQELYYHPKNNFTAEFIGTINRFTGEYKDGVIIIEGQEYIYSSSENNLQIDVLFRPEDTHISLNKEGSYSGILKNSLFLGNKTTLILEMSEGKEVILETSSKQQYAKGEIIYFTIDIKSFIFLKKEEQC